MDANLTFYPHISVIMPVFNGEKHLKQAIESVLTQTYRYFEFIIINDGSIDQTKEIIRTFRDERIIFIDESHNLGIAKRLNQAIEIAQGQFIARMDADDLCFPKRLEKQLEYMESQPEISVVGSNAVIFDEKGKSNNILRRPENHELIHWRCLFGSPIIHPSVMLRRLDKINWLKYNENSKSAEDYDLWTELIDKVKFYNIQEPLIYYRRHTKSTSFTDRETQYVNSHLISLKIMNKLLGENVSLGALKPLRGDFSVTDADFLKAIVLIKNVYRKFICLYPINSKIRQKIRENISSRLFRMAQANRSQGVRAMLISNALYYDPLRTTKRFLIGITRKVNFK